MDLAQNDLPKNSIVKKTKQIYTYILWTKHNVIFTQFFLYAHACGV